MPPKRRSLQEELGPCGAKTRAKGNEGGTCKKPAGWGTDHPGIGRCKYHGGSSPNHMRRAVMLEARRRMITLGEPADVSSKEALRGLLRASAGHVAWLSAEVGKIEDMESFEAAVLLDMYNSERDRLHQVAKTCSERGIDEAEQAKIQQFGGVLNTVIRAFADRVGLTDEQKAKAEPAIRAALALGLPAGEGDEDIIDAQWEEEDRRTAEAAEIGLAPDDYKGEEEAKLRQAQLREAGFYDEDPGRWDAYVAAARKARAEQYRRMEAIEG